MSLRIGFGYDVHQLETGKAFFLGGIEIPHEKGAVGHSDADTFVHALCDALLGAVNLRDIGFHFPDTAADLKGIDSTILLKEVVIMIRERGWSIVNIDSTIVLQRPKISSFIPKMKQVMANILGIPEEDISIKGKTTEKLGFEGREEGLSVYVVALLQKS